MSIKSILLFVKYKYLTNKFEFGEKEQRIIKIVNLKKYTELQNYCILKKNNKHTYKNNTDIIIYTYICRCIHKLKKTVHAFDWWNFFYIFIIKYIFFDFYNFIFNNDGLNNYLQRFTLQM